MISKLLNKITGRDVRFAFFLVALAVGVYALRGIDRVVFIAAIIFAGLNWVFQILQRDKKFTDFADAKYWPTFVLIGVAAIFGHESGWAIGAIFGILDGMYFDQNY